MTKIQSQKKTNKAYTKSYIIKKLVDKHFFVKRICDRYPKSDSRYWTILVNPDTQALFVTCVRYPEINKVQFRLYTTDDVNMIIETSPDSPNVLLNIIDKLINKDKDKEKF